MRLKHPTDLKNHTSRNPLLQEIFVSKFTKIQRVFTKQLFILKEIYRNELLLYTLKVSFYWIPRNELLLYALKVSFYWTPGPRFKFLTRFLVFSLTKTALNCNLGINKFRPWKMWTVFNENHKRFHRVETTAWIFV